MNVKSIIFLSLYSLFASIATSQVSRPIRLDFPLREGQLLKLDNKRMSLVIKAWEKNSIQLAATVKGQQVQAISEENLFALLGVTIKENAREMRIESKPAFAEVNTQSPGLKQPYRTNAELKAYLDSIANLENRFSLFSALVNETYQLKNTVLTLYVPATRFLKIDNKYGDINFVGTFSHVQLDVKNGNLKIDQIDSLKMDVEIGTVSFQTIKSGKIELGNATFIGSQLGNVALYTKSSVISYQYGDRLKLDSKMDDITIGNIGVVEGKKDFKQITIDTVRTSIDLKGENADLKISWLQPSVRRVEIDGQFATIKLPVERLPDVDLQVEGQSTIFPAVDPNSEGTKSNEPGKPPLYTLKRRKGNKDPVKLRLNCEACIIHLR